MNSIIKFHTDTFINALKAFFDELKVPVDYLADDPASPEDVLGERYKATNEAHKLIADVYALGMVNDAIFEGTETFKNISQVKKIKSDYDGLLLFGVTLKERKDNLAITRNQLAEITRAFNKTFPYTPVTIIFKYNNMISFANSERINFKQEWREGEKIGKVTMLKDVNIQSPHAAHVKILSGLAIDVDKVYSFNLLYLYWQKVFSLQSLNNQFYSDLQDWFYYATQNIKLPNKPDYIDGKENIKNFLVRLLARTMFCWFVKEKGLIRKELLELIDWQGNKFKLTKDVDDKKFLNSNSYYRGILQNIFFNSLNKKDKSEINDFGWTYHWHSDLNIDWFKNIPYLNGGIFDSLFEDNFNEEIDESKIKIPNYIFYGRKEKVEVTVGQGRNKRIEIENIERKGLNGILNAYKFTLDENTPFEEDIALDPEMLGLVFENLLAELDPNLEESTIQSIRKQTGSYYTPRKVIFEMVNDSLNLYLSKYITENYPSVKNVKTKVSDLVYYTILKERDSDFENAVVEALDKFKALDPACGSGAFPMGMLHRIVDLLKVVDYNNEKWISFKLRSIDKAQQSEFKKVLTNHLDDYGRKLGIIRDSIYGIDIQPLAVQITKLRFFISLLIDQKTSKGITPMPNIETKIICADSLKNIEADMFSNDAILKLIEARTRYYQPDISISERKVISDEIIDILDAAFPSFSYQLTGKRILGQNKLLLQNWFTHGTIAAPFFNLDFFYPELSITGGFDCIIGNPPYGGMKISDVVRQALDIESKDPYGAFIARFLNRAEIVTPLKNGGVLAFIVSDTFMTIKSHFKLRKHLMQNYIHKMLRVHPDTFKATVNTVVMIAERNTAREIKDNHICLMADLTNISIHDDYEHFVNVLNLTKGIEFEKGNSNFSNEEYAIYYYPQSLIKTNNNLPFFVANPKLFAIMNDCGKDIKKEIGKINGRDIYTWQILLNNKPIRITKLGDNYQRINGLKKWNNQGITRVISGIKTGSNIKYLKTLDGSKFSRVDEDKILTFNESLKLSSQEKQNGIQGDKYYLPFDMGQPSGSDDGWLPNYFQDKTKFYINWSKSSVDKMKAEAHSDLANWEFRCKRGIVFSKAGFYAPTFRISTGSILDSGSNGIFSEILDVAEILPILTSKLVRFFFNSIINHTVNAQVDDIKEIPISVIADFNSLSKLSSTIIKMQMSNPRYDYASHEQIEIDKLVYDGYGLNKEDIMEIELWYQRRYPKLSAAQKANLRLLGKSDDYLELYGLK